ncbi:hypothetical protein MM_0553 [Methanosarcina mazei Go1]|uniref:Uncharacterized protein n=1 Tax=Methanosarcina mazei (strain ATCC BAA-159 / DSM 3647 / Goe1 / Go1 / JCM 11833 / OCM 88) TaxID=192952 RepID=Q8PZE1_METMA|nr:hypothetical protein MM_0553 [Methanosarcina mazei Go1]
MKAFRLSEAGFNPCFNGSCSRICRLHEGAQQGRFVSILVLMDLARELIGSLMQKSPESSFNPCFNGSCSRICSRAGKSHRGKYQKVSILVLMDLARE